MKRKRLVALGLLLGSGLITDQILLSALEDGYFRGRRIAPFDPPVFYSEQETLLRQIERHARTGQPDEIALSFDADLGWAPTPGVPIGAMAFDWAGCRLSAEPLARERSPNSARVVCVGCSFTQGEEVADAETWAYDLDAASPRHEFANLAMGAYGLDQALLRYRRDGRHLEADEIWVGWLPSASLRLLTVWRPAERHWAKLARFKPRFRLDASGGLIEVPNPVNSIKHMHKVMSSQEGFLAAIDGNDGWVSRSSVAYAPTGSHWLHGTGLGRMALTLHEHRDRDAAPWLLDENSEVFRLLLAVMGAFQDEAASSGARLRLLVLPDRPALQALANDGRGYWSKATEACERAGIEVIDCGAALIRAGAAEATSCWAPGGHYSAQGHRVVAESLRALLEP